MRAYEFHLASFLAQRFDQVFVHQESLGSPVARRVLAHYPQGQTRIVTTDPFQEQLGRMTARQFAKSKRTLFIKPFPGTFFKRCPGATQKTALACCNYYVLNLGSQCDMNCSYCYLQSYLNYPSLQIYSNIDQALLELEEMAQDHSQLPFRVGTGEVIDSLSLDPLTLYSHELIAFFAKYPKWTLEFKTKSAFVDHFLHLPHAGNVVVSWSLNCEYISSHEEHGTASLQERLAAARRCADKGFKVAFHLDPLIWHPEWKSNYQDLVQRIQALFSPDEVHVLSMGTLRFQPEQRHMMRERFGMNSWVTKAEVLPSEGGKLRYDSQLRVEMASFIKNLFQNHSPKWKLFMCMETPENWVESFAALPSQVDNLKEFFRPLPKVGSPNKNQLST